MAARLLTRPVTASEVFAAAAVRARTRRSLYLTALTDFRAERGVSVEVSRMDLAVAAEKWGRAVASQKSEADAWCAALTADLDRLVRGVAGTDVR